MPSPPPAPPTHTLDASPYLAAWLVWRLPELAGKVSPLQAGPNEVGPYCTFAQLGQDLDWGQDGPGELVSTTYRVELYGRDRTQLRQLAGRIVINADGSPGLAGFAGLMSLTPGGPEPDPDDPPARLDVQCVTVEDDAEDLIPPPSAKGVGWVQPVVPLTIHHNQRLR